MMIDDGIVLHKCPRCGELRNFIEGVFCTCYLTRNTCIEGDRERLTLEELEPPSDDSDEA